MHSARPPSAPPTTSTPHARPSPVQTSQHNHDSQGVTYSGRFAAQLQNQPLQPPPSAVAVGARAASVSTTQTRRTMVQRVWSVGRPSIIQSQFYQAPPAALQQRLSLCQNFFPCMQDQLQQHITSRRRPRASRTTPRHRQHRNINVYSLQQQRWHVLMACGAVAALVREWSPRPYF